MRAQRRCTSSPCRYRAAARVAATRIAAPVNVPARKQREIGLASQLLSRALPRNHAEQLHHTTEATLCRIEGCSSREALRSPSTLDALRTPLDPETKDRLERLVKSPPDHVHRAAF